MVLISENTLFDFGSLTQKKTILPGGGILSIGEKLLLIVIFSLISFINNITKKRVNTKNNIRIAERRKYKTDVDSVLRRFLIKSCNIFYNKRTRRK